MIVPPSWWPRSSQPAEVDARGRHVPHHGPRLLGVLALFPFGTVAVTAIVTLVMHPGDALSNETRLALGKIVGKRRRQLQIPASYLFAGEAAKERSVTDFLENLIPSNIFASLSNGETLKA